MLIKKTNTTFIKKQLF